MGGTTQLVTITINGANDTAIITGPVTGTAAEAGVANGTPGTRQRRAISTQPTSTIPTTPGNQTARCYGRQRLQHHTVTASGLWTYTPDNSNPAVQALNVGQR